MNKNHCSFRQLPFSELFNTYIEDFTKLKDFFEVNPFNDEEVTAKANSVKDSSLKPEFVDALKSYHTYLGISDEQETQLSKFSSNETLVVVTGQQLGVYGGPLFTIYKTITTILLARKWEKKLGKAVVPVFWLADEDHDFEEIASIGLPNYDQFKSISLIQEGNGLPVSVQDIKESIKQFHASVKEELPGTDFSEKLFSELEEVYSEGKTHVQAFAQLMSSWFSKDGLLIVGSNFDPIKNLVGDVFSKSISSAHTIYDALNQKSADLEKKYHRQVIVGESNLFYIDSDKGRIKIDKVGSDWKVGSQVYSEEKLVELINSNPSDFSPNVFLRPIIQDKLLPTIGYVAGPGELAYYGQMKSLYPEFGLEMPVIFPRLSATLLESGIERILEKLPFQMCSYNQRIEDLEALYVEKTNSKDIEGVFSDWKKSIQDIALNPTAFIKEIDPTLEGTTGKVVSGFSTEIDKLKGKVYRAIKQQEQTQLNRIAKIKSQLFPDGLQERSVSPIVFMNKYGLDIWDKILKDFEEEELDLTKHHIISI